ncbi:MAG: NAD-dependent epimerase/dehydratase family protein [Deltaproteobacteria bacterium]|nr:NAD-dependent epimerase/dehydratase family protein [Deltaproteobacteria bacterium]MCB9785484.1 NAD-dependent epimerase/dehydratase family protein [Deltaproteobacteria bacterium]
MTESSDRGPVLVTGAAGFIGYHVTRALLERGETVLGVDNFDPYYDPALKEARLSLVAEHPGLEFHRLDIADRDAFLGLLAERAPRRVVHLAAQAGVRHSIDHPFDYVDANLVGFINLLEASRRARVEHLVFASSSSVYGQSARLPFTTDDPVSHPLSLYAATKKANELMAHAYSHLHAMPVTGLRFFTVYGPWGRPDMALFLFTEAMLRGEAIPVFNHGEIWRDFTYIDDVVEGVLRTLDQPARPNPDFRREEPDPASSDGPYRLYNIGNGKPVKVLDMIDCLAEALGVEPKLDLQPMHRGDGLITHADCRALEDAVGYRPDTPLSAGIARFVQWYRAFYGV